MMQVHITARHIGFDDNLKIYVNNKLGKLERYNYPIEEVRAVFQKEKFYHITEITLTGKGLRITAFEKDQDMKASFDLCLANAQKQLKKAREKVKRRKVRGFFEVLNVFKKNKNKLPMPKGNIVRVESFAIKPMSAEEAALELEAFNKEFIVFHNAAEADNGINILYRRKDGDYGLIQP
jgi:putative sigma-54 modulation protein